MFNSWRQRYLIIDFFFKFSFIAVLLQNMFCADVNHNAKDKLTLFLGKIINLLSNNFKILSSWLVVLAIKYLWREGCEVGKILYSIIFFFLYIPCLIRVIFDNGSPQHSVLYWTYQYLYFIILPILCSAMHLRKVVVHLCRSRFAYILSVSICLIPLSSLFLSSSRNVFLFPFCLKFPPGSHLRLPN